MNEKNKYEVNGSAEVKSDATSYKFKTSNFVSEAASESRQAAAKAFQAAESGATDAYRAIESGVVGAYKTVENTVVDAYKAIEGKFVETFLEPVDKQD